MKRWILLVALISLAMCSEPASVADVSIPETMHDDTTPTANSDTLSYLALGDSYTIGERVSSSERWCVQLAALLSAADLVVKDPDIIARTGWTTSELKAAIKQQGNEKKYELVSLSIGVNNQYRGQSIDTYRTEFSDLLNTSISYANGNASRVFVLSIPDWGVSPYGASRDRKKITNEIEAFNQVAREECANKNILFVDITPISRRALDNPQYIADDNLHFSGAMYGLWAAAAVPLVTKLLP